MTVTLSAPREEKRLLLEQDMCSSELKVGFRKHISNLKCSPFVPERKKITLLHRFSAALNFEKPGLTAELSY